MKKPLSVSRSLAYVAGVTVLILMIPLVSMQFSDHVNWQIADFIVMGPLLFSIGTAYVLLTRYSVDFKFRFALAVNLASVLLLVWANLAVGLIGSGPHMGNLMYIGVLMIWVIGVYFSKLTSHGMAKAAFATAISLVVLTGIALVVGMQNYAGSSVTEIIRVNSFFAGLFLLSGLLFKQKNHSIA